MDEGKDANLGDAFGQRCCPNRTPELTGIGLAVGAVGAAVAARMVENLLFGVSAADPLTYAATVAVFLAVTVVASFLPAMRATRVNPLTVLRDE